MEFTGTNLIGFSKSSLGDRSFKAFSPSTGTYLDGDFTIATSGEFEQALQLAGQAFPAYKAVPADKRAEFLEAIADEIMNLGEELLVRCSAESGLPLARITGERGRTCGQLRAFAKLVRDGWYVDARIDKAQPERAPLPKPDIRRMLIPMGPVAVFGASNFPLAFSTAGGDTASALAAGCPVVVKSHSSHAGTNELVSLAILKAAQSTGMPEGVFSSLYLSHDDSVNLVQHPVIKAVGFTGSRAVGMRFFNAAVNRPEPIPVYAEMSSINPVVLLPGILKAQADEVAGKLAASVTMGVGQFCTNPGLVLMIETAESKTFLEKFSAAMSATLPGTMLNKNICNAYAEGIGALEGAEGITLLARASKDAESERFEARPAAYSVSASNFLSNKVFTEEVFGPATLVVLCKDETELHKVLGNLEGQLTATVHATGEDDSLIAPVIELITQKAGRVIYGGFPTGVEVCDSMQHGGPFPSTTDSRSTSVGTAAIYRFLRPVAYQDLPDNLLPLSLQNSNPLNIIRLVDGDWTKDSI
jgi:alpha-ketoglutaric semialdehyde dehydrogenase